MQIEKNKVVTFDYTVTDENGGMIESSHGDEPLSYLHGAGGIAPGLESAMEGKVEGDSFAITLRPEEGFGERDEELVHTLSRDELAELGEIEIGMQLHAEDESGIRILTVSKIEDDEIILDENHPLAGMTVKFDVKVVDVRDASDEEKEHGHPHVQGCGGGCDCGCSHHS